MGMPTLPGYRSRHKQRTELSLKIPHKPPTHSRCTPYLDATVSIIGSSGACIHKASLPGASASAQRIPRSPTREPKHNQKPDTGLHPPIMYTRMMIVDPRGLTLPDRQESSYHTSRVLCALRPIPPGFLQWLFTLCKMYERDVKGYISERPV
jgi:hypothetical protein